MPLYREHKGALEEIKESPFKLEKHLQELFEANLEQLMGLELVKSEFSIAGRRIDTLAFDPERNAFIIIEYKRSKNISVIDQGFAYLGLMLENKSDFIIEYNESLGRQMKRTDPDWSQTRVAFVSSHFTKDQRQATNFKDLAIELWEVRRYANDTIAINPIRKTDSAASVKSKGASQQQTMEEPVGEYRAADSVSDATAATVREQIKVYTEEDLMAKGSDMSVELFEALKERMLEQHDAMETSWLKEYMNFKVGKQIIMSVEMQKKAIKLWLNVPWGTLQDPKGIARDVRNIGHFGVGDYQFSLKDTSPLSYLMSLVQDVMALKGV